MWQHPPRQARSPPVRAIATVAGSWHDPLMTRYAIDAAVALRLIRG